MASMGEALYNACLMGRAREFRRLLSGGADVNDVNEEGLTPLAAASQNGHVVIVDMLLAAEANANAADDTGHTALHRASFKGHLVIVQHLLASGADAHAVDNKGFTSMMAHGCISEWA